MYIMYRVEGFVPMENLRESRRKEFFFMKAIFLNFPKESQLTRSIDQGKEEVSDLSQNISDKSWVNRRIN
jgi:hypothetical protein